MITHFVGMVVNVTKDNLFIFFFFRSVFFGDISPKDRPEFYVKCIHSVYQTYADNYRKKNSIDSEHTGLGKR